MQRVKGNRRETQSGRRRQKDTVGEVERGAIRAVEGDRQKDKQRQRQKQRLQTIVERKMQ